MQYQKFRETPRLYLPEMAWALFMLGLLFSLIPHAVGSYEEMGDIALISRQNALAADFDVLRGAYSRLGFFHPGPISFYWMAFVDWLLPDSWFAQYSHYYPYCMAVWLANTLMGLASLGAARKSGLSFLNRLLLLSLIVFFLWHLGGHLFFSPWGPHLTILPMLWFCLNLIRAGEGDFKALPALAFASIWILHSHAGSLIFLGPSLLYLLFLWYGLNRENSLDWQKLRTPFLLGLLILLVGLSLPVYEALVNDGGNIAAILHYLGENSTWRKPGKALLFMLSTMDGPLATVAPIFFPASLMALYWIRKRLARKEKRLLIACVIVMLGSFYGALRTPGVLVPHLFDHLLSIQAVFVSVVWTPLLGRIGHLL
ncbi:MAG: hypothetical protein KDK23_11895, partial [Leptospiraceae bacterium]|nr:hypothetical protein [Leptospiraceae bacterium]